MPLLLTKLEPMSPDHGEGETHHRVSYNVGRTLALTLIALFAIVGAVVLWALEKDAAAYVVFSLGQGVVTTGLGIAVGERRGAEAVLGPEVSGQ